MHLLEATKRLKMSASLACASAKASMHSDWMYIILLPSRSQCSPIPYTFIVYHDSHSFKMMQFSITWLVVVSFIATSLASRLVLHEKRDAAWTDEGARTRVEPGTILPMRIALIPNQVAQDNAEQWLLDVSDPDSPNYARHWTLEQVIEAFKPSATTLSNVTSWLHTNNIHEFTHSDNKQWFAFDIPAKKAEKSKFCREKVCVGT